VVKTGTLEEPGRALRAEYDALAKLVRAANINGDRGRSETRGPTS